jgi:hypothetical protein
MKDVPSHLLVGLEGSCCCLNDAPLVPTVTQVVYKNLGKRYNTVGAETPKIQYSSAGWVRKVRSRSIPEKNLPELDFVIC